MENPKRGALSLLAPLPMSNLYLDSGYLNIEYILNNPAPFKFVVGGRGIGKTYGALDYVRKNNIPFMFLRRTQSQVDLINKPEFSPFKKINEDHGCGIIPNALTKYNIGYYESEENEDGKIIPIGPVLGYTAALSTFSNIRGFDASDVQIIIFDEFIPESHERPIKNEFSALMNCYETINRNRELQAKPPCKLLCLANANNIANPCFIGLNLIKKVTSMYEKGQEEYTDRKRGIALYILQQSPVSEKKRDTALYRLAHGSAFAEMALENKFSENVQTNIRPANLKEYVLVVGIGELFIYRHKSNGTYYCTTHKSGVAKCYADTPADVMRFKRAFGWVWMAYVHEKVYFEEYICEILLTKYFK